MISGDDLRAVREAARLGVREMARRAFFSAPYLSMVETGQREVTSDVLSAYERVLGLELRDDDAVHRRDFLWLLGVAGVNAISTELAASIAGGDAGPLATVQTSHGVDMALAALADRGAVRVLRRWAHDEPDPVLRVNATGILAKLPGQEQGPVVAELLDRDQDIRNRYMTAVIARVCGVPWSAATGIVAGTGTFPRPRAAANLLIKEVVNTRDAGARWCSATMLRNLAPMLGGGGT